MSSYIHNYNTSDSYNYYINVSSIFNLRTSYKTLSISYCIFGFIFNLSIYYCNYAKSDGKLLIFVYSILAFYDILLFVNNYLVNSPLTSYNQTSYYLPVGYTINNKLSIAVYY